MLEHGPYAGVIVLIHVGIQSIDQLTVIDLDISAEQSVPEGEYVAIVSIRIRHAIVMVDMVHVGCAYDLVEDLVYPIREYDIGMIKLTEDDRSTLVQHHQPYGGTDYQGSHNSEHESDDTLTRMMSIGCGGVHMLISVMNGMKLPHPLHMVLHPVCYVSAYEIQ